MKTAAPTVSPKKEEKGEANIVDNKEEGVEESKQIAEKNMIDDQMKPQSSESPEKKATAHENPSA